MPRKRSMLGPLVLALLALGASGSTVGPKPKPFRDLGKWLDRCQEATLKDVGPEKIERALKVIASSQSAFYKTLDGAAHGVYAYTKSRSEVGPWTRLDYSRASVAEKEDRLKVIRKAKLLEEAFYSAELSEITAEGVDREQALELVKGLQANTTVVAEDFSGPFRWLLLLDEDSQRVTLSIGDSFDLADRLDLLYTPSQEVRLRSRGLVQRSFQTNPKLWEAACAVLDKVRAPLAALRSSHPSYGIHVVGFSLGGAVAALVGGVLEGSIMAEHPVVAQCAGMAKACNFTAMVFAPPPCMSSLDDEDGDGNLKRFLTTFILGDDMVPRSSPSSLRRLEKRLVEFVPKGDGTGAAAFDYARSWMKGVLGATVSQVVTHQVVQSSSEGDEEKAMELIVPGRVYYVKPRKLHGAATIKEVMVGTLREDLFWQIHDVFVSKSMLAHHRLPYYIKILARLPL